MRYVPRTASERLERLLRDFPAVLVYGPRQCGKSTLVRAVCRDFRHLDLERPADLGLLEADLEGFLAAHPRRLTIDEAQRLPELFPALRHAIDSGRGAGRFVLTGSASPALIRSVTESLAGRVALVELTPFRSSELPAGPAAEEALVLGRIPARARPANARGRARTGWMRTSPAIWSAIFPPTGCGCRPLGCAPSGPCSRTSTATC